MQSAINIDRINKNVQIAGGVFYYIRIVANRARKRARK